MFGKLITLAVFIAFQQAIGVAQSPSNDLADWGTCNLAIVKQVKHPLAVRSGAGTKFRTIDRLNSGTNVYTCDSTRDWYRVFYSTGACASISNKGLDVRKTKGCQSGWVAKKWIEVLSG
jgi:uncharacterized protein YgiM (DUF1202 family)